MTEQEKQIYGSLAESVGIDPEIDLPNHNWR